MKRFVIGDIHGAYRALLQCFERSGFNRRTDLLICLGDLCDGWPDVVQVLDELQGIKHLVLLRGNHDVWFLNWLTGGTAPDIWLMQGGDVTVGAYKSGVPAGHIELLKGAGLFHILDNYLFVHGGILPELPIEKQAEEVLLWDRSLVKAALLCRLGAEECQLTPYKTVYVGHTPTLNFGEKIPIRSCGVCLMDTGAGWPGGVLTMMDIDTGEYFGSDVVSMLYEDYAGRL